MYYTWARVRDFLSEGGPTYPKGECYSNGVWDSKARAV